MLAKLCTDASADSLDTPPTQLPPLEVEESPLAGGDVTVRPYLAGPAAWSHRSVATLKDALGQAPGVVMQESFGGFEPPRISVRGSGLQSAPSSRGLQFLLDGFPLSLADGSFNAALIDPQLVGRAEVLRGESAARLAPAVMGGAIHLRSPVRSTRVDSIRDTDVPLQRAGALSSSNGSPRISLRTELGSFGAARALASGRAMVGNASVSAAGSFSRMDGYREHSAQTRHGIFAKATLDRASPQRPGVAVIPSIGVYHVRADYAVPGPLTLAAAAANPRAVSADVQRDRPRRISSLTQVTADLSGHRSELDFEAGASWLRSEDWFRQLRPNGISDSEGDDYTVRAALARRFDSVAGERLLRLTATASRGWRDLRRFRNDSGATGPLFGQDKLEATTAAADLEATIPLREDLLVVSGVSAVTSRRDISDRLSARAGSVTTRAVHSSGVQPRAQVLWKPRRELAFFAGAARTIEPPTFDDLVIVTGTYPNLARRSQSLSDQHATTLEFGVTGSRGPFGCDVTAYRAHWTNEILRLADAQGVPRGAVNAGRTRHSGLETAFHWQILEGAHRLRLTTTATWARFTFDEDPVFGGNRLAGAPPHLGAAQLLYENPRGFFASAALDWTGGRIPVDHANRLSYGGHTLAHLRLGWRPNPRPAPGQRQRIDDMHPGLPRASKPAGWTVFGEVKNLFDREHIASTAGVLDMARNPAATAVFLPGPGRAIALGIEWTH